MAKLRRLVLVRHGETERRVEHPLPRQHGRRALGRRARADAPRGGAHSRPGARTSSSRARCAARGAAAAHRGARPPRCASTPTSARSTSGRWEGLTREEIQARDPVLFAGLAEPRAGASSTRAASRATAFRARSSAASTALLAADAATRSSCVHKGVIREIVAPLTGSPLAHGPAAARRGGGADPGGGRPLGAGRAQQRSAGARRQRLSLDFANGFSYPEAAGSAQDPGPRPRGARAREATEVSSSPLRSRSSPKRVAKSARTAGTSDEPPVRNTRSTAPGAMPARGEQAVDAARDGGQLVGDPALEVARGVTWRRSRSIVVLEAEAGGRRPRARASSARRRG